MNPVVCLRYPPCEPLRLLPAMSAKQAAQELSVTATAISHQIRGLEEALGLSYSFANPGNWC